MKNKGFFKTAAALLAARRAAALLSAPQRRNTCDTTHTAPRSAFFSTTHAPTKKTAPTPYSAHCHNGIFNT